MTKELIKARTRHLNEMIDTDETLIIRYHFKAYNKIQEKLQ